MTLIAETSRKTGKDKINRSVKHWYWYFDLPKTSDTITPHPKVLICQFKYELRIHLKIESLMSLHPVGWTILKINRQSPRSFTHNTKNAFLLQNKKRNTKVNWDDSHPSRRKHFRINWLLWSRSFSSGYFHGLKQPLSIQSNSFRTFQYSESHVCLSARTHATI